MQIAQYFAPLLDADLFRKANAIRTWVAGLTDAHACLNEDPNPYYGQTLAGLVLIESYGLPKALGTPHGEWDITNGGNISQDWLPLANERLGLVKLCEETQVEALGCFGPVWAVTKDLDGNALPVTEWQKRTTMLGVIGKSLTNSSPFSQDEQKAFCHPYYKELLASNNSYINDYGMGVENEKHWDTLTTFELHNILWQRVKTEMGFQAARDRVDPNYFAYHIVPDRVNELCKRQGWDAVPGVNDNKTVYGIKNMAGGTEFLAVCGTYPKKLIETWPLTRTLTQSQMASVKTMMTAKGYACE